MSSPVLRVVQRADVPSRASVPAVQRQLARYNPSVRPAVQALAARHRYLAQLAQSFPALLLALAWPRAGFDPAPVIAAVVAGHPLEELAASAKVPLWLRKMPPQMLTAPLPLLPDSPFLRRRMVNHLPGHAGRAPRWFRTVAHASRWVGDDFALWCARVYGVRQKRHLRYDPPNRLYVWAWFSMQPGTPVHALIEIPWNPDMDLYKALCAAWSWRQRMELVCNMAGHGAAGPWLRQGYADGYEFVPLRDAADIDAEARAMRNCLRTYGEEVVTGRARLWSMRRDGERIATMEVGVRDGAPMPHIQQLCLVENGAPPSALWQAAWRWLVNQDLGGIPLALEAPPPLDRKAWQSMWKPYWLAMGRVPSWLPLGPSRDALYDL